MSNRLINLLDNVQQYRDSNETGAKIYEQIQKRQALQQQKREQALQSRYQVSNSVAYSEPLKPEGGRAYLPTLFNSNPALVCY